MTYDEYYEVVRTLRDDVMHWNQTSLDMQVEMNILRYEIAELKTRRNQLQQERDIFDAQAKNLSQGYQKLSAENRELRDRIAELEREGSDSEMSELRRAVNYWQERALDHAYAYDQEKVTSTELAGLVNAYEQELIIIHTRIADISIDDGEVTRAMARADELEKGHK